jgi:hypothetical protein
MLSTISGAEGLLQFLHASFEMTWHGNVKILSTFFSKIMTTLVIHFSTLPKKNFHFSRHRVLFAPWLFHSNLWGRCYGKRKKSYDLWDVEKRPPYIIKIPWNLIGPVKQATTMTLSLILGRHLKHGLGYPALQVKVGHSTTHLRLLGWSISLDPSL